VRPKKWTVEQLKSAAENSFSIRNVLKQLSLRPTGGNYAQIKKYLKENNIDFSHFRGKGWNKGLIKPFGHKINLDQILVENSDYQSYKLKNRLVMAGLKSLKCEICGWAKKSKDGRIPVELDHINGHRKDNRIGNLRILCPNCHSLQPTHRGLNFGK
jgi:hypothetical protein